MYGLETIGLSLTDSTSSTAGRRIGEKWSDVTWHVMSVRENRKKWEWMKSIFFQTLSCGLSRGLSLGYCWLIHCFCSCCKVRFCFGSGQPQQPSATRFWSWLVFLSPVLCVLSARPACTNQSLRLRVFLEILLRNRSAQIVGCVVVAFFFCLKENITDFVFVLLFK